MLSLDFDVDLSLPMAGCIAVTVHRNMKMIEEVVLAIGGMEVIETDSTEIELEEKEMRETQ